MYFDEQDVVGESCGTQLDVDMMMAPLPSSTTIIVPRPSFLMPLPGVATAASSFATDSPTTPTGLEDVEEALEKDEDDSDVVSSLWKLLRRAGPNDEGVADGEPESPTTARMTLTDAESLAALSIVVPPSQQDAEVGSLNANAMQRLHLQTPRKDDDDDDTHSDYESLVGETPCTVSEKVRRGNGSNKRPRSSASSPASSSTSSSSTCASAVVLARKRALKESWRDRQMTVVPRQEDSPVFDDEDDEQAPRITSFVEYDAADMDNLVIAPSQDYFDDAYDAEGENEERKGDDDDVEDIATENTQQQTCGFVDFRDLTQFNEECSEVFDNVIYAPKSAPPPPAATMPPIREADRRSRSRTPPLGASAAAPEPLKSESTATIKENSNRQAKEEELGADSDSESSLSDGFDIPPVVKSNEGAVPKCIEPQPRAPPLPPPPPPQQQCKGQWNQRRSVKRDCTFIENHCASPAFEGDEDFEDDALALSARAGTCERSHAVSRIVELKADSIDSSSDDFEELSMKHDDITAGTTTHAHHATVSSVAAATRSPLRFQPRVLKKRRKAQQLGLQSFFWSRPCT